MVKKEMEVDMYVSSLLKIIDRRCTLNGERGRRTLSLGHEIPKTARGNMGDKNSAWQTYKVKIMCF